MEEQWEQYMSILVRVLYYPFFLYLIFVNLLFIFILIFWPFIILFLIGRIMMNWGSKR